MGRIGRCARQPCRAAVTLGLVVAVVALVAVPSSGAQTATVAGTNTATAVRHAAWTSNVSVSVTGSSITIASNGVPSTKYWTRPSEYAVPNGGVVVPTASTAHVAPDPTIVNRISITVRSVPTWSAKTTPTSLGPIGILLSGAPLFNPYEGNGKTVALANNFFLTNAAGKKVYFVDKCNGHPTPMGAYHYHGLPTCITTKVDGKTGRSHLLGVALDGYPIYGARDINGKLISPSKLDACNGIFSPTPEFPKGFYHYVLPAANTAQSALRCYHGTVSNLHTNFHSAIYVCGQSMADMAGPIDRRHSLPVKLTAG